MIVYAETSAVLRWLFNEDVGEQILEDLQTSEKVLCSRLTFIRIMDAAEQARRWASAKEKLQAAQLCYDQQLYGESTTRSYYACYQAMWAAVGDPALGLWRHGGLINEFCRGRWGTPTLLPSALTGLRKKLEALYRLRIAVDYAADSISQAEAESGLDGVRELFQMIAHHTGWAL